MPARALSEPSILDQLQSQPDNGSARLNFAGSVSVDISA
jgi:hypothetical protein